MHIDASHHLDFSEPESSKVPFLYCGLNSIVSFGEVVDQSLLIASELYEILIDFS